jgi:hypothetical protein
MVVRVGTTVRDPEVGSSTPSSSSLMFGVILTDVAFVVFQVKVVYCPLVSEVGPAENATVI